MRKDSEAHSNTAVRREPHHELTAVGTRQSAAGHPQVEHPGVPVFAVREWAARFYEQDRLERDAAWWRLTWPFAVALVLAAGSAVVVWRCQVREPDLVFGGAVVLAAAAVGVIVGGVLRVRTIRSRRVAAATRPATVESLPEPARALVLDSPRLRFRRPTDAPAFAAVRDEVTAAAPVGEFAASVLVWALVMRGHVDGTLEDWVRARHH